MARSKKPRSERLTTPTSVHVLEKQAKKKQKVAEAEHDKNALTPEDVENICYKMVEIEANYVTDKDEKARVDESLRDFKRKLANTPDPEIRKMACEDTKKVEEVLDNNIIAMLWIRKKMHRIRVDAFPDEVGAEQNGELQPIEMSDEEEDEEDELTEEMPEDEEE